MLDIKMLYFEQVKNLFLVKAAKQKKKEMNSSTSNFMPTDSQSSTVPSGRLSLLL